MFERYTEKARRTIFFARYEASQFGSPYIETEHVLLGLLREDKVLTQRFLRSQGNVEDIRRQIESATTKGEKTSTSVDLPLSNECKRVLAYAAEEAERLSQRHIGTEHLLLGLLREEKSFAAGILHERGVRISFVREALAQAPHEEEGSVRARKSELPSDYSTFLTKLALEGRLLPCIGREREIQQVMQALGRSNKNNVVLVGEHGAGKRSIADGVVRQIADDMGPVFLQGKLFAAVDLATLVAAAQRSGRPKEFLDTAAAELTTWGANTIFVFDELHMLLAGGDDGAQETVLLLKSALLEGKVRCIALATPEDYAAAIKKSPWLERCFRVVRVEPPSQEEAFIILQDVKSRFEKFHTVAYTDEALKAAVVYSSRHVKNRSLPDKAIDLLDDAGAFVKMRHAGSLPPELVEAHKKLRSIVHQMENAIANHEFEKARFYSTEERKQRDTIQLLRTKWGEKIGGAATVTVEDVEEALSRWTGMPVTLIRHEVADTGEPGSKLSKTTRKRKKKSS